MVGPASFGSCILLPPEVAAYDAQAGYISEQTRLGPALAPGGGRLEDLGEEPLVRSFVVAGCNVHFLAELGEDGELKLEAEVPALEGEGTRGGGGGGRDGALVAFATGVLGKVAVVFDSGGVEGSEEGEYKCGHFDGGGDGGEEEEGDVGAEIGRALYI